MAQININDDIMKKLFKTTMLILLITTVFSCKKNENADNKSSSADSTETTVDSVGPYSDSTNVSGAGTTGATGDGSTGSGSAGTVQKGNTSVRTDSTANNKGGK
ncbi:hypothetical protein AR687_20665 [Flavobacteriaceae bacterium CRH]|nr:hypothetical protein AR687_20665 [Flavobacteriaceae bacterium CRH]